MAHTYVFRLLTRMRAMVPRQFDEIRISACVASVYFCVNFQSVHFRRLFFQELAQNLVAGVFAVFCKHTRVMRLFRSILIIHGAVSSWKFRRVVPAWISIPRVLSLIRCYTEMRGHGPVPIFADSVKTFNWIFVCARDQCSIEIYYHFCL